MAVTRVEIRPERIEVQRNVAGRMGAVDHRPDAARPRFGHSRLNRQDQGGGRGDVRQEQHAGFSCHAGQYGVGETIGRGQRQWHRDHDNLGPGALADIGPGFLQCGIFVVGCQNLVARLQVQRLRHHVQRLGCVDLPDQIVGLAAQFCGQGGAGGQHPTRQTAFWVHKSDRLPFKLHLPVLIGLKHRLGAGAIRPMVQKDHIRVQKELFGQIVVHCILFQRAFSVGSSASRKPSPKRVVASTVIASAAVGKTAICQ